MRFIIIRNIQLKRHEVVKEMETGSSVSKGCFAYKGKKRGVNTGNYCQEGEGAGTWNKRLDVYQTMWEEVDTDIQILQSDLNTKIFDDLLHFTKTCHAGFSLDGDQKISTEIPTAALVTGVNTPDHGVMFSTLVTLLQERVSPLVAILQSKDCNNVKNILSKVLGQILQNPQMFIDDEEAPEINQKNLPCSLLTLVEWYHDKHSNKSSSPKKKKSADGTPEDCDTLPPVVLVFADLESFIPRVLQDFITICSNYIPRLPIVFVFGIATSVAAVHRLLPNAVSSMLCLEKFQAPPSTEYLTLVVSQILMTSRYPFKLGYRVFQLLIDIFLYHDFSVLNFIKGLQFSMMDHMFTNPLAHLCCPHKEIKDQIKKMNSKELETLRHTPSFMRHVEGCDPNKMEALLLDDNVLKKEVEDLLTDIHEYHELFFPVLSCLHVLVAKLPRHPLGKQLREVYCHTLGASVCDTEPYKESMDLLRMMSKDDLTVLLQQCVERLGQALPKEHQELPSAIQSYLDKFDKLHELTEEDEEENVTDSPVIRKTDLHSLKKQLQQMEKKKKKLSPYEKVRNETVDFFHNLFVKYLPSPKTLPLHELLYYDAANVVRSHLNASPRSAVQTALGNPQYYLQSENFDDDTGTINPNMPDVCIVYKLHLECSQLINLYDWLQAFVTVVTADEVENEDKIQKPDKVMQARFIRAVSELQFLGFIKPTKRKTDHVARLTWGGC